MNSFDARVRYTRMIIEKSFLELIQDKPASKLTVTELCEKAQIITADLPCRPCSLKKKCKFDYDCIKKISPDMVKKAIDDVL